MTLEISEQPLTLNELRGVGITPVEVVINQTLWDRVALARKSVEKYLQTGQAAYGINTGFGKLATIGIEEAELYKLQTGLVRSHAVGVGPPLSKEVVRLAMLLKVKNLAQGYSGVRSELLQALCAFLNHDVIPVVPSKGSVGASGDLAPLAHIALTVFGEGEVFSGDDLISASEGLCRAGLEPLELAPKEGLSLVNGTEISTALAMSAYFKFERVFSAAVVAAAMSTDAMKCSSTPFDQKILSLKKHTGQQVVGTNLRKLLNESSIRESHVDCDRVQDPYSVRCIPQVLGACWDVGNHVASVLLNEFNSVSDNPLVFAEDENVLSGGNFHAESIAMAADFLALSLAEIGSIAERRIALLIDENMSDLPSFLTAESGLNSGFMMPQVTAAALVSENKSLAHPASVDSIPTSANQEDHVSMATYSARRLHNMLVNLSHIVAIELLAAAQGIEFHRPLKSSDPIEQVLFQIRQHSERVQQDRSLSCDIEKVAQAVLNGDFCEQASDLFLA